MPHCLWILGRGDAQAAVEIPAFSRPMHFNLHPSVAERRTVYPVVCMQLELPNEKLGAAVVEVAAALDEKHFEHIHHTILWTNTIDLDPSVKTREKSDMKTCMHGNWTIHTSSFN